MRKYDVVVCGGGLTGVAAAVQAKRSGAGSVLLIERYGFLGGLATNGLINPFMPYWKQGVPPEEGGQLVFGIFEEILHELEKMGGLAENRCNFDAECMKIVLQRMCLKAGVELLLHTVIEQVHVKGDRMVAVRVANKSGIEFMAADSFIDCTGDADVAHLCGCPWKKGRDEDGQCQPMTLCFRMGGVDRAKMPSDERINELYDEAKARGEITNPREDVLHFDVLQSDVVHFNTTRVILHDATSAWSLTDAEITAREQVWEMVSFLKNHVPGFENAYLQVTAAQTGARESRRIVGEYVLTGEDVMNQARFADAICRFAYMIDIHNPAGSGTERRYLPEGGYYEIPFRCLVPKHITNLLVAGRTVSCDHVALSSLRVMPACAAMGQAAGLAAAERKKKGVAFKDLNGLKLHNALVDTGAMRADD